MLRLRGLEPDVRDDDLARLETAGRDREADLPAVHRHRHVRTDGRALDLARVGVHARGQVDRDDRDAARVHRLDQLGGLAPRLAAEAGPEQPVDENVALESLLGAPPGRLQRLERDPGVAAVGPAAADAAERARVGEPPQRLVRDRAARSLHQRGDVVPRFGRPHLGGRVEGLKHPRRPRSRPRAPSSASSRGRSARRRSVPTTPSCGRTGARPASAARRSRSRAT